ncbi:hypothetical protein ACF06P_09025 [Streptomyces sp. NPDC015684]
MTADGVDVGQQRVEEGRHAEGGFTQSGSQGSGNTQGGTQG